jgi:DNA repair protein RadD
MLELRPYQRAALDAVYAYWTHSQGNPLVVLPTGTGKALCIAKLVQEAVTGWPDTRVLMLTHVKELIQQNYLELMGIWPDAPAGIYSAGLGKRDIAAQVLFAGIQSIHRKAEAVQKCDLMLIDECQLVPRSRATMYGSFIATMRAINPDMKVIGWSATPFRMDTGMLHEGEGALFDGIAYEYSILSAIQEGYLAPVHTRRTEMHLDTAGVGTRGGEFIPGQLEAAVDTAELNAQAVKEIMAAGVNRRSWLVFCSGVAHAEHIRDELRAQGITCETVTGATPVRERDRIIADFKAGRIRALTNANVLTTGFNAPATDLLVLLRPTKSAGLYIQMVGRGTRLAAGKEDCLVLDFAGNIDRFGPIDQIKVRKPLGEGEGDAPTKDCPECETVCFAGVRLCPVCGFEFPPPELKITPKAADGALLSTQIPIQWAEVSDVAYKRHEKPGKPPSLRVDYRCGMTWHREWVCLSHTGFARQKACAWWQSRAPRGTLVPNSTDEALDRVGELAVPREISLKKAGKYTEITGYRFG